MKIILDAAAILEKNGWCQTQLALDEDDRVVSVFSEQACRFCAVASIQRAAGDGVPISGALKFIDDFLLRYRGYRSGIVNWNDTVGRTKVQVIELFKEAVRSSKGEISKL